MPAAEELEDNRLAVFKDVTALDLEPLQATALLRTLVNLIAYDVSMMKRNAMSSYGVVYRSRQILEAINSLIELVDDGDKNEEDDTEEGSEDYWAAFEKYTSAIHPLEAYALLFGFSCTY